MTGMPHITPGQPHSEELIRIIDDYRRTHDADREALTVAQANAAIDWWNDLQRKRAKQAPHVAPKTAAGIMRAIGLPAVADRIEVQAHPGLAELDVQLDGYYDDQQ